MATFIDGLTFTANDTGSFRAWVSGTESALSRIGWVNVSASGAIDYTTVNPTTAATQIRGYSVWRFDDSYQTDTPVFVKVDYGSGAAATRMQYGIQAGRNHDGNGTVFNATTRVTAYAGFNSLGTQSFGYSGDGGRVSVVTALQFGECVWGVERGRNANGTPSADQLYVWALGPTAAGSEVSVLYNYATSSLRPGTITSQSNGYVPLFFIDENSFGNSIDVVYSLDSAPAAMLNYNIRGVGSPTGLAILKRGTTSTGSLNTIVLYPYEQATTYLNVGNGYTIQSLAASKFSVLIRWE